MTYLQKDQMFGYCQWWNSITKKMQGGRKKIQSSDNIDTLIANYSFNRIPTKFIFIDEEEENKVIVSFRRTSEAITLIPGQKGGLYPHIRAKLSPRDVGLIRYRGVHIGWPESRQLPESAPLASIIEISESQELGEITNFQSYQAAYRSLESYTRYEVIAQGRSVWRGQEHLFLNVIDDNGSLFKIRCGEQLRDLMDGITEKVQFMTQGLTPGGRDINVVPYEHVQDEDEEESLGELSQDSSEEPLQDESGDIFDSRLATSLALHEIWRGMR